MVGELVTAAPAGGGQTVVYGCVSPAERKSDLDRQVARVTVWATDWKLGVDRVVTEVGSVLDGHREKFLVVLRDSAVTTIVVELCALLYVRRAAGSRARCAVGAAAGGGPV